MENKELLLLSNEYKNKAAELIISDEQTYSDACEFVKKIKVHIKLVEEHYSDSIDKAKKAKAAAEASRKAIVATKEKHAAPAIEAERIIKSAMNKYFAEQERIRQEKQRKLEEQARREAEEKRLAEAVEKDDEEILDIPVETPKIKVEAAPKHSGVYTVEKWVFQIINPELVPDKYKTVNEKLVNSEVQALKEKAKIPGVKIWKEIETRVRT